MTRRQFRQLKPGAAHQFVDLPIQVTAPESRRHIGVRVRCQRATRASGARPCSTNNSTPCGLSTRRISRSAICGSGIEHSVHVITTESTESFPSGKSAAEPSRNSTGTRRDAAARRAIDSIGIYVGSTVHEVAQVIAIGKTVGGVAAENAVIVKMIRVMLLAPFLIILGRYARRSDAATDTPAPRPGLPAFAIRFIIIALVHPYLGIPEPVVKVLRAADIYLLAAAMAALGLDTTIQKLKVAGREALFLGAVLFGDLIAGGGIANLLIQRAFGVAVGWTGSSSRPQERRPARRHRGKPPAHSA